MLSSRGSIAGPIRFNKIRDLFFRLNDRMEIEVTTPKTKVAIQAIENSFYLSREDFRYPRRNSKNETLRTELLPDGTYKEPFKPVLLDSRVNGVVSDRVWLERFFEPSAASLIVRALRSDKDLYSTLESFVDEYELKIAFYGDELVLSQGSIDGQLVLIPFSMISDTIKRMFFYFSLISMGSNHGFMPDYVLVLEEPEVHSYPPYVKTLAQQISSSKSNQFFIATHSPYLLETLYENAEDDELQVFVVDYQNHQTVVHPVDNEALGELIDNRADVFFNLHNLVS